jgi:glutamate/tyrosine decarboxylase-like PLP-dependent enzyme
VSDQAHYSNQRAVNVLGIGLDNLRSVDSDDCGRIVPQALSAAIEQDIQAGHQPFYIGLTAGTTVVGAFDPVQACSDIAIKHDLWLHIDGAWGAPVLFSKKHRSLLADSHLADSFAWDAHKLMNVPITAAAILVKHAGMLKDSIGAGGTDYLFHSDANSDYNLGERSLQCGRRADALKVWLSWKAVGNQGFENKIDQLQELKNRCVQMIKASSCFAMLAPADYLNILFRFSHPSISEDKLDMLNVQICKTMMANGGPYVDFAQYKGKRGIRLILANELTTKHHLERLLGDAERIGNQFLCNPSSLSL